MPITLNPYLSFDGNAREAMQFYQSVLGGDLTISTYGEFNQGSDDSADNVMHSMLTAQDGMVLMGSDTPPEMKMHRGDNISISLSGEDADRLRGWWEKLSESGSVVMPLERQIWGDEFGACTDRFGIGWMVNIGAPQ